MNEPSELPWLREPVRLQLLSGHFRYLLEIRREPCDECAHGTRVHSLWVCGRGRGETISWCGHCFNAICEPRRLDPDQKRHFQVIRGVLDTGEEPRTWPAVRPALEDLARKGWIP